MSVEVKWGRVGPCSESFPGTQKLGGLSSGFQVKSNRYVLGLKIKEREEDIENFI